MLKFTKHFHKLFEANLLKTKLSQKKSKVSVIQVYPQGIAVTGDDLSSFVLFKDAEGKISFPVWCPVLPFGIISNESEMSLKNPYELTHSILNQLDFKLKNCTFDDVESEEQLATLKLESLALTSISSSTDKSELLVSFKNLKVKAFEALAICGSKKEIEFFATSDFIQKTRDVAVQDKGSPTQLLKKNSFVKSRQKYIM